MHDTIRELSLGKILKHCQPSDPRVFRCRSISSVVLEVGSSTLLYSILVSFSISSLVFGTTPSTQPLIVSVPELHPKSRTSKYTGKHGKVFDMFYPHSEKSALKKIITKPVLDSISVLSRYRLYSQESL